MHRRFFLQALGCGCLSLGISSCTTVPITDRKQLKLIPESKLNAKAAQIYEKIKEKEKLSDDIKQLDEIKEIGNRNEAFLEVENDIKEGADIIMIKPGLSYLDIIRDIRENFSLPIAVYQVSGEYSMVKAAAEKGWLNENKIIIEQLTAFKRAGASMIVSYHSIDIAKSL